MEEFSNLPKVIQNVSEPGFKPTQPTFLFLTSSTVKQIFHPHIQMKKLRLQRVVIAMKWGARP